MLHLKSESPVCVKVFWRGDKAGTRLKEDGGRMGLVASSLQGVTVLAMNTRFLFGFSAESDWTPDWGIKTQHNTHRCINLTYVVTRVRCGCGRGLVLNQQRRKWTRCPGLCSNSEYVCQLVCLLRAPTSSIKGLSQFARGWRHTWSVTLKRELFSNWFSVRIACKLFRSWPGRFPFGQTVCAHSLKSGSLGFKPAPAHC